MNGAEDAEPIKALGVLPHFLRRVRLTDERDELAIDHVLLGMFQAPDSDLVDALAFEIIARTSGAPRKLQNRQPQIVILSSDIPRIGPQHYTPAARRPRESEGID